MKLIATLLFLQTSSAYFFTDEKCRIDNRSLLNMWEYKIFYDRLKCGYDTFTPPAQNNSEALQVNFHLALKKFNFYSENQEFSAYMWLILEWHDYRLEWDPKDYDGLRSMEPTGDYLWTPRIKLVNAINDDYNDAYGFIYETCVVKYSGFVHCVGQILLDVKCNTDLYDWPYDAQVCMLEIGPASEERGYKIKLNGGPKVVTMFAAEYGLEWDIMDYNQSVTQDSEKQVIMSFRLERHAEVLTCLVVYPSLTISVLTLSALFIDFRRKIRLLVICFSLMCHFNWLPDFFYNIPEHSNNPPRILLYFRGSLVMTIILTVISFILYYINSLTKACPNWMIFLNEYVYSSYCRFLVWPRWKNQDQAPISDNRDVKISKEWTDFANIINSVWIMVFFVVYIALYVVFVPQPIPITY